MALCFLSDNGDEQTLLRGSPSLVNTAADRRRPVALARFTGRWEASSHRTLCYTIL